MKTFVSTTKYRCTCTSNYFDDIEGRICILENPSLYSTQKGKVLIFANVGDDCPVCHTGWRLEDR